ncbi:MAG: hypothetical protein IKC45_01405 [Clostridia bacterium]|nr:hypothetical protein [Clostridia bacterium]
MNKKIKINFNEKNDSYEINHNGFLWVSDGKGSFVSVCKNNGGKQKVKDLPFRFAKSKKTEYSDNKIVTRYSDFYFKGEKLPFTLICTAEVVDENAVVFSLESENETGYDIQGVYFPASFNSKTKGKNSYHIDPMRQGFMLPDRYLKNFFATHYYTSVKRPINAADCYMPVWGRVCDGHTFTAIVETPYDASFCSSYGKHLAFVNSIYWQTSLGKVSYERKIRYVFHDNGDYNTVAKDYRNYLFERNQLVTLDEKIEKNPNIKNIIGVPVLHHKIFSKINEKSQFYDKNGSNEILCATFCERAEQMKRLKSLGLDKLYIHTDGWGKDGYDNKHPYILPPCEEAGGWDGFKKFSEVCRELGYVFALHDQYRDYYYDSPVFDKNKAVTNIDGSNPYCSIWDGGEHSYLCSVFALDAVKKTYTELEEHGVDVQGAYLDVFSIMQGDECFHDEHRITREESMKHRAACFDYLNEKGLVMSSEEPGMQLLNNLALVHHGPHALRPQENGKAIGIPIPFGNLVYHDCIMVPWNWFNNWGIPKGEDGDLYGALNAGMPYIHPYGNSLRKIGTDNRTADIEMMSDDELKKEFARIKPLCELQAKLYNKEMVKHEFLGSYRKQKATYSDGTTVVIDLDKNTYTIG